MLDDFLCDRAGGDAGPLGSQHGGRAAARKIVISRNTARLSELAANLACALTQLVDEHAHVLGVIDRYRNEVHAAVAERVLERG